VVSFGDNALWQAHNITFSSDSTIFDVLANGDKFAQYKNPLAGLFNVRNCLAVIAACDSLGLDREAVRSALTDFRSVKRRLEVRGQVGGVIVIDDFAHHPTAVRETLLATRARYRDNRIIAVFEPRSYTAQIKQFQNAFEEALAEADEVVIAKLFHPERYTAQTGLSPDEVLSGLRARGRKAYYIPTADEIVSDLAPRLRAGDVVVIMSNGSFGGIHEKLLQALRNTQDTTRTA